MAALEVLAPLILLIALGSVLAHIKFLGEVFMGDLNKLAFWIALPALLFTSASHVDLREANLGYLLLALLGATLLVTLLGFALCFPLGLPSSARGSMMQAAFRGNLAYIGIPVLTYSFASLPELAGKQILGTAVVAMIFTTATYNILAVIVLQLSQHSGAPGRIVLRSIVTNPLLIAGLAGLVLPVLDLELPRFVRHALDALGGAAVPIALLCIGGSLAITPLHGRKTSIVVTSLLKVLVLPAVTFVLVRAFGLSPLEQRIALVLASTPTAAAAYVMAREMGGDTALTSGTIALSTLCSVVPLAAALWLTT